MRPSSHSKYLARIIVAILFFAVLLSAACKNDSQSVVSNSGEQTAQAASSAITPANPSASATPVAGMTPATVPTMPVGPVGQTTPASPGGGKQDEKHPMMGNFPVTVSPAKPALTPAPDPFPPRPTPAVVMADGKVVQQWQAPAEAVKLANPVKDKPNAANLGREFYTQKCADCHGKAGKGNGWMSASLKRDGKPLPPTNLASRMVQANSDGELFWKITNGRSPMPAHRVRFDDEQRWYIVAYLRTFKQ